MEEFTENRENFEKLFLFEFLVDHVIIYNSKLNLDKKVVALLGPVAIRFQFLNYPPIEVNEDSFAPGTKPLLEEKKVFLKSGKSCMFSLSALKSKKVLDQSTFDVYLTVYRYKLQKYMPGCEVEKPEEVFIGRTMTNLGSVFKDLFQGSKEPSKRLTHTKTSASKLVDNEGLEVGKIVFLIRVSCFGFMVMTGFQLPEEEQIDFKYKHFEYDRPQENPPLAPQKIEQPCEEKKKKEKGKGDHKKKSKRDSSENKAKDKKVEAEKKPTCPYGYPPCCCPCRVGQSPYGYPNQQFPQLPPQLLNYSAEQPPNMMNNGQVNPNRARDMAIDPGAVGIRGNQLVFKMPDQQTTPQAPVEGKFASSVYYKMEDEAKNGARNVVQILPKNPIEQVDSSKVDEKQDVLILKLGKKRMAAGKKPKLELELRTPKMKVEKPASEAKDTQYLESDIPKPAKSVRAAKSGKGSSKGKGKKK